MPATDMPAAEVAIDEDLVRRLLRAQHPDLADRPLATAGFGWDNVVYRLGDDLVVRLPRRRMGAPLVELEQRWLPALAPLLPLPVPAPVRVGRPGEGYPWSWSVCPWFDGTLAATTPLDLDAAVDELGGFVRALHRPAPPDAPANPVRGVPLRARADATIARIEQLADELDAGTLLALARAALELPEWDRPPVWLHGDLHPANLLVRDGRLVAAIDFGDICAGDPASDLAVAWMLFPRSHRAAFRAAAGPIDDATWARAHAWALSLALAFLSASADNEVIAAIGRRTLASVLEDA